MEYLQRMFFDSSPKVKKGQLVPEEWLRIGMRKLAVKNNKCIRRLLWQTGHNHLQGEAAVLVIRVVFRRVDSRNYAFAYFIQVDNSLRAEKSFDRGQTQKASEMSFFKDNHVRNQKGSNVRDLPFKRNKWLYLSRFMDRFIYVDTGTTNSLTNEKSWQIQQICSSIFPPVWNRKWVSYDKPVMYIDTTSPRLLLQK